MRQVRLTSQAVKDLESFDPPIRDRIKDALQYLGQHPQEGKPLKGRFAQEHVWSYRVWPYRILYRHVGTEWLDILTIEHRRDVYR